MTDYTKFESDLQSAGVPWTFADVPDYGRINFYELAKPGPRLSYRNKQLSCERQFMVWPFDKTWAFAAYMLGWSKVQEKYGGTGRGIVRHLPQPLPYWNRPGGKPMAYASEVVSVECVGPDGSVSASFGGEASFGNYVSSKVTIGYSSLSYQLVEDKDMPKFDPGYVDESGLTRFVTRTVAPSAKHVQFPAGALTWEGGIRVGGNAANVIKLDDKATQTFGRILPYADVVYIWHQLPGIPVEAFKIIGKVNKTDFDQGKKEQLLVTGVDITPARQVSAARGFDVALRCKFFEGDGDATTDTYDGTSSLLVHGHNFFLRAWRPDPNNTSSPVTYVYDKPYSQGPSGRRYVFDSYEFRDFFRSDFIDDLSF